MSIIGIVAVDKHGAIGKNGQIPWHYSSDMRFFKEQTTGHACVMGYKTWCSLKRPLKDRLNIVLSRRSEIPSQENLILLRDEISVLSLVKYLKCNLFIIGGEQVYQAFLPHIDQWLVTEIPLTIEDADTFIPKNFLENFNLVKSHQLEEELKVGFYERVSK
jgi:dihydrofolate reductase